MQVEHRRDMMTESEVGVISFGDGPKIKKCGQSLEAGKKKKKTKKLILLWDFQKEYSPDQILVLGVVISRSQ